MRIERTENTEKTINKIQNGGIWGRFGGTRVRTITRIEENNGMVEIYSFTHFPGQGNEIVQGRTAKYCLADDTDHFACTRVVLPSSEVILKELDWPDTFFRANDDNICILYPADYTEYIGLEEVPDRIVEEMEMNYDDLDRMIVIGKKNFLSKREKMTITEPITEEMKYVLNELEKGHVWLRGRDIRTRKLVRISESNGFMEIYAFTHLPLSFNEPIHPSDLPAKYCVDDDAEKIVVTHCCIKSDEATLGMSSRTNKEGLPMVLIEYPDQDKYIEMEDVPEAIIHEMNMSYKSIREGAVLPTLEKIESNGRCV